MRGGIMELTFSVRYNSRSLMLWKFIEDHL